MNHTQTGGVVSTSDSVQPGLKYGKFRQRVVKVWLGRLEGGGIVDIQLPASTNLVQTVVLPRASFTFI